MANNIFTLEDKEDYVHLDNEYNLRSYVTFNGHAKEMTVFGTSHTRTHPIGELLIDFVTLDDNGILSLYEEDRLELVENLHRVEASDFDWDFKGVINEFVGNYLKQNNISQDDFAKKIAIYDFVKRYEGIHPYFNLIDLYTSILPIDNDVLLNDILNLKQLKAKATEIIQFCLDTETEKLNRLSAEKRYYFYFASGRGKIPQNFKSRVITLPQKIHLSNYNVFYKNLSKDFDVSKVWELTSLSYLKKPQDITDNTIDYLLNDDIEIYEAYEVNNFSDIIYLELFQMIINNISVKKCEWCGKYFVLKGDYINKYCDRIPRGKKQTCQHIGSTRDFNERSKKSETNVQYIRAYKRMHSRIKYGMLTKDEFKKWNMEAIQKTQLCDDGKLSFDNFKEWLGNK